MGVSSVGRAGWLTCEGGRALSCVCVSTAAAFVFLCYVRLIGPLTCLLSVQHASSFAFEWKSSISRERISRLRSILRRRTSSCASTWQHFSEKGTSAKALAASFDACCSSACLARRGALRIHTSNAVVPGLTVVGGACLGGPNSSRSSSL